MGSVTRCGFERWWSRPPRFLSRLLKKDLSEGIDTQIAVRSNRLMRGENTRQSSMLMLMSPESRVPTNHPIRRIKKMADEALMVEQDAAGRNHLALTTLPKTMSKKLIVRLFKERYRTERVYEEMKGELGLDHFEGRSYVGWHHHVSVAICCYAFVVTERMRHFFPSTRRHGAPRPNAFAA